MKVLCPKGHDTVPSLAVYRDHAFCFGCGLYESYEEHLCRVGGEPQQTPKEEPLMAPPRSQGEWRALVQTYQKRMYLLGKETYWQERGFSPETIRSFGLGYDGRAYAFPVLFEDEIQTIRFRRDDSLPTTEGVHVPKYWGLKGYNRTLLYAPLGVKGRVLWCEGELDALLAIQLGFPALSLTNGIAFQVEDVPWERLQGAEEIVVALDNDRPAYRRSLQLAAVLRERLGARLAFLRLPAKDLTEYCLAHGPQKTREAIGRVCGA